jgi:glycosyltransferase involved in cell wall biosynthesis
MNRKPLVSIVVPVYFNEASIPELTSRFEELAGRNPNVELEFIFVDDDSKDNSFNLLISYLHTSKHKVKVLRLSKNFGAFTACLAGLEKSTGDCCALLAADLQDPPEILDKMISSWNEGNEVVIAARKSREDPLLSKLFSKIYYKIFRRFALKDMPEGGFDFVLMDRKIRDILCQIKEKNTSLMGLILWSGFKREIVYYNRKARKHGESKWTFAKKLKYLIDSFVSFSFFPIRVSTISGIVVSIAGFLYSIFLIYDKLVNNTLIQGVTALIVIVLLVGGLQLMILGIFGEYLWRILDETRKRPNFIIDEYITNEKT